MKTSVQKWGNSLAVRIPKSFAEDLGLRDDASVDIALEEGAMVLKPDREGDWSLEALLTDVTDENIHPSWETAAASPSGKKNPGGET